MGTRADRSPSRYPQHRHSPPQRKRHFDFLLERRSPRYHETYLEHSVMMMCRAVIFYYSFRSKNNLSNCANCYIGNRVCVGADRDVVDGQWKSRGTVGTSGGSAARKRWATARRIRRRRIGLLWTVGTAQRCSGSRDLLHRAAVPVNAGTS